MYTDLNFLASFLNEGVIIENSNTQYQKVSETAPLAKVEQPEEVYVADILYHGSNSSKVVFCVHYENEEWITGKDRLFLEKILGAVGLSLNSIALINLHNTSYKSILQVGKKLSDSTIISLGLPSHLVRDFNTNEVDIKNDQSYLCLAWGLTEIAMDKDKKNILWKNLKKIFNL
ncbi:MAG: hypothetical protein HOD63_16460 [Bacteroidetes bacterium]|nr:hypothetical protein [Bacteroidota bacterium]